MRRQTRDDEPARCPPGVDGLRRRETRPCPEVRGVAFHRAWPDADELGGVVDRPAGSDEGRKHVHPQDSGERDCGRNSGRSRGRSSDRRTSKRGTGGVRARRGAVASDAGLHPRRRGLTPADCRLSAPAVLMPADGLGTGSPVDAPPSPLGRRHDRAAPGIDNDLVIVSDT